jgi:hypothetical protein
MRTVAFAFFASKRVVSATWPRCLGAAPSIAAGEYIQASGRWENHREHGLQFRATFLRATAPTSAEGMEKYLGSGLIKGIGRSLPSAW